MERITSRRRRRFAYNSIVLLNVHVRTNKNLVKILCKRFGEISHINFFGGTRKYQSLDVFIKFKKKSSMLEALKAKTIDLMFNLRGKTIISPVQIREPFVNNRVLNNIEEKVSENVELKKIEIDMIEHSSDEDNDVLSLNADPQELNFSEEEDMSMSFHHHLCKCKSCSSINLERIDNRLFKIKILKNRVNRTKNSKLKFDLKHRLVELCSFYINVSKYFREKQN